MLLDDVAFGIIRRRRGAEANGGLVHLVLRNQVGQQLRAALDARHKHAGGHWVERASVADLAGAEDAAKPGHNVVAGHASRLVHDDDSGGCEGIVHGCRVCRTLMPRGYSAWACECAGFLRGDWHGGDDRCV